nr:MAG TPA: hypothetical protein [Caudoviricetes sp.]
MLTLKAAGRPSPEVRWGGTLKSGCCSIAGAARLRHSADCDTPYLTLDNKYGILKTKTTRSD